MNNGFLRMLFLDWKKSREKPILCYLIIICDLPEGSCIFETVMDLQSGYL
jgi:hypothetical protein